MKCERCGTEIERPSDWEMVNGQHSFTPDCVFALLARVKVLEAVIPPLIVFALNSDANPEQCVAAVNAARAALSPKEQSK